MDDRETCVLRKTGSDMVLQCSKCGNFVAFMKSYLWVPRPSYCPNCGRRVVREGAEDGKSTQGRR